MAARRTPYAHNIVPEPAATEPPEIELEPENGESIEVIVDDDPLVIASDTPEEPPADPAPATVAVTPEPKPEPVIQPKPSADDEAYERLKRQLDREKAAREAAQRRADQIASEHISTQERLRQEQERAFSVQQQHLEAQEVAIDNAISFAESQAAQAQRDITRALNEGDYESSAAAYRILAKAESDLARLKEGKSAIEVQKKSPASRQDPPSPAQQPQQPYTVHDRVEAYITQPAHSLKAQAYMRDHYDDLFRDFDAGAVRLHKLLGGHYLAKAEGVNEGSDAYYNFLDRHMGYMSEPAPQQTARSEPPPPPAPTKPRATVPPAAPVSRSAQANSVSGTSITLTPAQVQFCRDSQIDPKTYARMLLKARKGASDPSYTGPRFTQDL